MDSQQNISTRLNLTPEVVQFLQSLEAYETLAAQFRTKVRSYSEASLAKYLELPTEIQTKIRNDFQPYLDFLIECSASGIDLRNDRLLLQTFLKRFQFIYSDEIFDQLTDGDIIEVYTLENIQIFHNMPFMDLCNYSLMELLTYSPFELYERSDKIKHLLQESGVALIERPYNTSLMDLSHIPNHLLREKFSHQRLSSMVQFKFIAPLYNWPPKSPTGFVVVQRAHNVAQQTSTESTAFL